MLGPALGCLGPVRRLLPLGSLLRNLKPKKLLEKTKCFNVFGPWSAKVLKCSIKVLEKFLKGFKALETTTNFCVFSAKYRPRGGHVVLSWPAAQFASGP